MTGLLLAALLAQDAPFLPDAVDRGKGRLEYFALRAGVSIPASGTAYRDADGDKVRYSDLVDPGGAVTLEWGALFDTPKEVTVGAFVALGVSSHAGADHADSTGTLDFEPMETMSATAGVRLLSTDETGPLFELFFGGGVLQHGSLDADFTPAGGGAPGEVEVYNRTVTGVGEAGLRIGFGGRGFAVQLGGSVRVTRGARFDHQFIDRGQAETMVLGQAELGIQIGF